MYRLNLTKATLLLTATAILFAACRKKDSDLQEMDNLVNFEVTAQGISAAESSIQIKLKLSRAVTQDVPVVLNLTTSGVEYGTDFTSTPAAVSGVINTTIPSGSDQAVVTIAKVDGALFDGDEFLTLELYSSGSPVILGANRQITVNFSELVATSATATMNGGGVLYPNKVFVDLSANRQTVVNRNTWDLGFYTGAEFRVILNSSSAMMAKQINKNDLTQVTAADTVGFSTEVAFSQTMPVTTAMAYIDHPSGDLTRTAIAEIAANAGDNKVYIVNRGLAPGNPAPARGWKKIRVIRNASGGYTLQHADIAATTFQEINIGKDATYFFKYISFETGAVNVEPAANKWDIAWTYFSNSVNFGGGEVPYLYQDIVLQNRNVQVAEVLTSSVTFDAFGEANLAGLTLLSGQTAIGANWRSGGGPTSGPAVRTDRFYVLKDGDGNYYKLRFTAMTQNGERGYPAYEVVLVKKA